MREARRKVSVLGVLVYFSFMAGQLLAQPTPGDTGLGAASGGVVGGGADLGNSIWMWLIPAIIYFAFKWKHVFKQWFLNPNTSSSQ